VIHAGVAPENVARTIEAIDTEVRLLGREGPTVNELEETRDSLIGAIPRMLETNESIADFMLFAEQFALGLDYHHRLPGLLQQVTMDDVKEAAADILNPARAAVAIAGPPS
jgi:zinc protease